MRTTLAACVLLTAFCGAAGGAVASPDPLEWLEDRIERVRAGDPESGPVSAAPILRELAERLRDDGEDPRVADALVAPPLRTGSGGGATRARALRSLEVVRRRLVAYRKACERPGIEVEQAARPALEEILRDDAFRLETEDPSAMERVAAWVRQWVQRSFRRAWSVLAGNVLLVQAIVWGLVIAAAAVAVRLVVRHGRWGRRYRPVVRVAEDLPLPEGPRPEGILALALERGREGRVVDAMRAAQQACVLALRRAGLLPEDPGLTDLEGVARLDRASEPVRAGFRRVVEVHDGVVYGGRPADPETLRTALDAAGDVVRAGGEAAP